MSIDATLQTVLTPILPAGWRLLTPRRRGPQTLELRLMPPDDEGLGIGLEWSEGEQKAYAKGPRYNASYRRGPGLIDLGEPEAPEHLRTLALAACDALAALTEGPSLAMATAPTPAPDRDPIDALLVALPEAIRAALGSADLPNPEGWELREVSEMMRWTRVAEVKFATEARALTMILTPSDPERPAFKRTARHDLIYYSDDLAVSEHDALYARDATMIEAFATWFDAWDR